MRLPLNRLITMNLLREKLGRRIFILFLPLFMTGCGLLKNRTVDKTNESVKLIDRTVVETTSPGDKVYITIPALEPERPKSETKTYQGSNGAVTDVDFDDTGTVTGIRTDCPEVTEKEMRDIELDYGLKTKEVESKANIELANTIGKWTAITLIPIGFFFALAYYLKK